MGERVGKYKLQRKLGTGGMAEVWLARAEGPGGFSRQVVVKRIHAHLLEEIRFVQMFLGEAALVAKLSHPNIVQLFDFGEESGTPYLAMEWMDGPNLKELVRRERSEGRVLPPEMCARLVAMACEGLAYAHEAVGDYEKAAFFDPDDPDGLLRLCLGLAKGKLSFEPHFAPPASAPDFGNWHALARELFYNQG